ncbi:NAD(P)/FAD-dependent oxidoreductase [Maricaulis sp.]|uniref:NAD(P)/FAD-dependent oxidoreductase n=1 Tax=Maricaulis sp. TaxID=1486257 RepID=UPI001B2E36AA|nr:NAD(P)/FAD-dependent oxidoreductase [Maricaulis sp.]MBO6764675.1 NAD(P)/FAD-dependent oxidoreductase [Maricaulis sp.]
MTRYDVVIVGAGAAGMMCAIEAGRRGRSVCVIEHGKAPGEKIRISGGGRCNFTNLHTGPGNFLSANPHFAKSALKRYTQWDFIDWVDRHGIAWHEKTLGQLFCDQSARQIVDGLTGDMRDAGATLRLGVSVTAHMREGEGFRLDLSDGSTLTCQSLVIASGGKSIPKMGATGFGYDAARQYGLAVTETRPALVPLTFDPDTLARFKPLSGVAADVSARCNGTAFEEAMLFTHRGLSGPAILQISSFWREGHDIVIRFLPGRDWFDTLRTARTETPRQALQSVLSEHLPKRLAQLLAEEAGLAGNMADQSDKKLQNTCAMLESWTLRPTGSEGYRTAEVTLGGVDTNGLDSRTLQARSVPGLYFIGEVVDVTGWLGGYNFQWAWSSGWSAGQVV